MSWTPTGSSVACQRADPDVPAAWRSTRPDRLATPHARALPAIVILLFLLLSYSHAATTGKVIGLVTDADTGEPLPGANIIVVGTTSGAMANPSGHYIITNVPVGERSVRAEMIGYRPVVAEGLLIVPDRTAIANFELEQTAIELDIEITVVAERPLVRPDATSKLAVVTGDEISEMPVKEFSEVLALQGGFTTDSSEEIHVRGGRTGEIAYMIDGMYVEDPLYGGFGSQLNSDAIEELVVMSGTFNAEYGDALSGVVNVITKDGGSRFSGRVEYTSPILNDSPYRKKDWLGSSSDVHRDSGGRSLYSVPDLEDDHDLLVPLLGEFSGFIGGPVPGVKRLRYFAASRYYNENGYLPFGYEMERDLQGKLTYLVAPGVKFGASLQRTNKRYKTYSHAWKYRQEGAPERRRTSNRLTLTWNQAPTARMFYSLGLSRFKQEQRVWVPGQGAGEEYTAPKADNNSEFYIDGYSLLDRHAASLTYTFKGDLTWQATDHHEIKTGIELKRHDLSQNERTRLGALAPVEFQEYDREPLEGAVYLQDKMEFNYAVLNAGLRFDYVDAADEMWDDEEDPDSPIESVPARFQLSPRLGLAHPVTERTVLHFAYGHFFQNPTYDDLYYNHLYHTAAYSNPDSIPELALVGNPSVKAQKTVAYEVGLQHQLTADWAVDVTAFYKDITDLLATEEVRRFPYHYIVYTNLDYANSKGIDLSLRKRLTHYVLGSLNYTYSVSKGSRSFPRQGFFDVYSGQEERHREYFLDFDRTHDIGLNLEVRFPERFFLRPLASSGVVLLADFASGLPYTPYVSPGMEVEVNSARMDWTGTVDLRGYKRWRFGPLTYSVFGQVDNLFDRRNPLFVYSRTGKPWDSGSVGEGVEKTPDFLKNPAHVGAPRTVRAGLSVAW